MNALQRQSLFKRFVDGLKAESIEGGLKSKINIGEYRQVPASACVDAISNTGSD